MQRRTLKNDLWKLLRQVYRKLICSDPASAVPVLLEVLNGSRQDIELKLQKVWDPHCRQFRVDPAPPPVVSFCVLCGFAGNPVSSQHFPIHIGSPIRDHVRGQERISVARLSWISRDSALGDGALKG